MSLPARIIGVIRSPRATFEAVAGAPHWAGVLALTFFVSVSSTALVLQTEVGRLALLDQLERTAIAFGQPLDDTQYAALEDVSENGVAYAVMTSLVSGPLLAVALSAILYGAFQVAAAFANGFGEPRRSSTERRRGGGAMFRQVLAVVAHASVILALRQVIAAPVIYARETIASPMTLTVFFTMLDEASPLARFAGTVDLFVIWWVVVLAVGMSVLYRRPARRLALLFVGVYIALAIVLAVVMTLTGGTSGPFGLIEYYSQPASERDLPAATTRGPRRARLRGGVGAERPVVIYEGRTTS